MTAHQGQRAAFFTTAYRPTFTCLTCRGGNHNLCSGIGPVRDGFQLPDCTCADPSHASATDA